MLELGSAVMIALIVGTFIFGLRRELRLLKQEERQQAEVKRRRRK